MTGASKGIGKTIALALAEAGAWVAVNYNRDGDGARDAVNAIVTGGGEAYAVQADISAPDNVARMFGALKKCFYLPDILINNAGISPVKRLVDYSMEQIAAIVNTNLLGAMYCSKMALPHMIESQWGRIVNISSLHSVSTNMGRIPYAASKGGMNAMTRALAVEYARDGVRINCLIVGCIATERTSGVISDELAVWEARVPMGRWGAGREVADAALYLCSESSSYINGACLTVDGGFTCRFSEPDVPFAEQKMPYE